MIEPVELKGIDRRIGRHEELWHPGSFTKNFSWGRAQGLRALYEEIRTGFGGHLEDVPRALFRSRLERSGREYNIVNFFLLNGQIDGKDHVLVDELAFQALEFPYSEHFDHLALFAFIYSMVGTWRGARPYQQRPALWAHAYVAERVGPLFNWDTSRVSADDIEAFLRSDPRYRAQTTRKLSTNLNFMFQAGGLRQLASPRIERWWADAAYLALDRLLEQRRTSGKVIRDDHYESYLTASGFHAVSGPRSMEKDLALRHVVRLFQACDGRARFNSESMAELTKTRLPDIEHWLANDPSPVAAIHGSNPRLMKTIPRPCAMIAKSLGFQIFEVKELAELDVEELVRRNLEDAVAKLRERGISPKISAAELMKLMRDE